MMCMCVFLCVCIVYIFYISNLNVLASVHTFHYYAVYNLSVFRLSTLAIKLHQYNTLVLEFSNLNFI